MALDARPEEDKVKLLRFACVVVAAVQLAGCSSQQFCWESPPASPLEVVDADIYEDGGTALVIFTDARGCEYRLCRDGRESEVEAPRHLYINATYPTEDGARVLDPASRQGRSIHRALVAWFEERMTEKLRVQLFELKTLVGLSESETRTARVLELIRGFGGGESLKRAASN